MPDSSSTLKLSLQLDQAKAKQVLTALQQLRQENRDLASDIKKLDTTTSGLANNYGKFTAAAIQNRNEMLKGTKAAADAITVYQRLQKAQQAQSSTGAGAPSGSTPNLAGRIGSTSSAVGAALSGLGAGGGQFASVGGQVSQVVQQLQNLSGATGGVTASLGTTIAAAGIAAPAVLAVGAAVNLFAQGLDEDKKRLDNAIEGQKTYYELIATGTTESIKAGLLELQIKRDVAAQTRRDLQGRIDDLQKSGLGGIDKFTEDVGSRLSQAFGGEGKKEGGIISSFFSLTDQAKKLDDEVSQDDTTLGAYRRALGSVAVAQNDAKKAAEDYAGALDDQGPTLAQQIQTARQSEAQLLDQMTQARQNEQDQELSILQNAADQKVAIAQKEAEAEQAALLNLQRANAEAQTKLQQQEADDKLAYQRQETQAAHDHARRLLQIRKDEQASEVDLIRNRDFAGLAAARRGLNQKLDEENDNYSDERKQRLQQLSEKLADDQKAYIRDREARLRAYNQQLDDLRAAEKRDLAANEAAARLEITRLQDKLKAEQATMQARYTLLQNQETRLYNLRQQLLAGLISAAQARSEAGSINGSGGSSGGGTGSTPHEGGTGSGGGAGSGRGGYATGGFIRARQSALVNEGYIGQRESFSAGGRTVMLPYGMGMFHPLKSGRVNPNGGASISIGNISVSGSTLAEAKRQALKIVDDKLSEAFERFSA